MKKIFILVGIIVFLITSCAPSRVPNITREPYIRMHIRVPSKGNVWFFDRGKLIPMEYTAGYVERDLMKQALKLDMVKILRISMQGDRALLKIRNKKPTFYTRFNPTEIEVARFIVQGDKKQRYIEVVSKIGSTMGYIEPEEDSIGFNYAKTSGEIFRITLKESLRVGEYGIVVFGGAAGYSVYDFAITE